MGAFLMDEELPPIPEGYKLAEPNENLPPLPEGYSFTPPNVEHHEPTLKERAGSFMTGVGSMVPLGQDIPAAIGATLSKAGLMHGSKNIPEEGGWLDRFEAAKRAQIETAKKLAEEAPAEHYAGAATGLVGTLPIGGPAAKAESALAAKVAPVIGETAAKYGTSALGGAGMGALYGVGEGVTPEERLENMKTGTLFGAGAGAVAPAIAKGAEELWQKGKSYLGAGLEEEGAKRAAKQYEDLQKLEHKAKTGLTPADVKEAAKYGQETLPIDVMGEPGISAAKWASTASPEAKGILESTLRGRNKSQQDRVREFISDTIMERPGENIYSDAAKRAIREEADKYVPDAYIDAYASHPNGIWSVELENMVRYPSVQKAIPKAMDAFNQELISTGRSPILPFQKTKSGWEIAENTKDVPLEVWDKIKRELQSSAKKHETTPFSAGDPSKHRLYSLAAKDVTQELKKLSPKYEEALAGAKKYLGEESAWNLGSKVAKTNDPQTIQKIKSTVGNLTDEEKGHLAHSYMQQRMGDFDRMGEYRNIANIISPVQKSKDIMVLGADKANLLHTYLHRENMMNKSLSSLGGSDTANKFMAAMKEMVAGHKGGFSVLAGAEEAAREAFDEHGDLSVPRVGKAFIKGAFLGSLGQRAIASHQKITVAQANQLAEMLVSKDQNAVNAALDAVHRNPVLSQALSAADVNFQNFLNAVGSRMRRATGGKIGNRDYPAKRLTRMERAVKRAQAAIALETKPLMQRPDEQIAQALEIAKDK